MPVEQRLSHITPKPRQAFLLVALEGLSEDDAAKVLDVDVPTLRRLVEESGRELAAEIATDVLIIEDETFIAMDLEGLVESLGHRVLGVARTHSEARRGGGCGRSSISMRGQQSRFRRNHALDHLGSIVRNRSGVAAVATPHQIIGYCSVRMLGAAI
jgi:hypothetical protein